MQTLKAIAIVCGLAAVSAGAAAQDQAMTPDEIKSSWIGKKVFARSAAGGLVDFSMLSDGSATVAVGNTTDTGTWRLTPTGYCATWQKLRGGQESCFTVVRRGADTFVLNADGSVNTQILRVQ
jgi:hypothetical protein